MIAKKKSALLAGIISILLVFSLILTACPTDSGTDDDDKKTEDTKDKGGTKDEDDEDDSKSSSNPFKGTWTNDMSFSVTVTDNKWTLRQDSTKVAEGTYTYSGKKATLTATGLLYQEDPDDPDSDYVWGTPSQAGLSSSESKGTATISGDTLTVDVLGDDWEFEKD
jgi:predicted small secreted protein